MTEGPEAAEREGEDATERDVPPASATNPTPHASCS